MAGFYFTGPYIFTYKNNKQWFINKNYKNYNLSQAASLGRLDIVKYLVSLGADVTENDNEPVRLASREGHLHVVKYLASFKEVDVTAVRNYAICWASERGHLDVVKFLASLGADVRANNDECVRHASSKGHLEVVKFLKEKGANLRSSADEPIRWAAENGHLHVVKYLASPEVGANISSCNYGSACNLAYQYDQLNVFQYAVSQGADVSEYDNFFLRSATEHGRLHFVRYLIRQGAEVNDDSIRLARLRGHMQVVKYLISQSAEVTKIHEKATRMANYSFIEYLTLPDQTLYDKALKFRNKLTIKDIILKS